MPHGLGFKVRLSVEQSGNTSSGCSHAKPASAQSLELRPSDEPMLELNLIPCPPSLNSQNYLRSSSKPEQHAVHNRIFPAFNRYQHAFQGTG
jgi:hypothetical protein